MNAVANPRKFRVATPLDPAEVELRAAVVREMSDASKHPAARADAFFDLTGNRDGFSLGAQAALWRITSRMTNRSGEWVAKLTHEYLVEQLKVDLRTVGTLIRELTRGGEDGERAVSLLSQRRGAWGRPSQYRLVWDPWAFSRVQDAKDVEVRASAGQRRVLKAQTALSAMPATAERAAKLERTGRLRTWATSTRGRDDAGRAIRGTVGA